MGLIVDNRTVAQINTKGMFGKKRIFRYLTS